MLSVKETMELTKLLMEQGIRDTSLWIKSHSEEECRVQLIPVKNRFLLVEDTKSGKQFWQQVVKEKYGRSNAVLDPTDLGRTSGGVGQLYEAIRHKDDDKLYYVLCDEVEDLEGSARISRNKLYALCYNKPELIRLPGYLSFESVVLSSQYLPEWLALQNESKKDINLQTVRDQLHSYNINSDILIENYKYLFKDTVPYRIEPFMKQLLEIVTRETRLHITNEHLSTCWQSRCCYNDRLDCALVNDLQNVNKCLEVLKTSYIKSILKGVIL